MPKAKPTQVIVHRIEFQETERELLEALVITKSANNIIAPILNNVAPIGLAYITYKSAKATHAWLPDWIDRTSTVLANYLQPTYNRVLKRSQAFANNSENEDNPLWV